MVASITEWILASLREHGAWSVFLGVIIESVIVPIPSPLIIMTAGVLLVPGDVSAGAALGPILLKVVLPGSLASTIGAYFMYGAGWLGGKPLIDRCSRFLGFDWEDVLDMERRLRKGNVAASIFLLRALPVVPLSLISAALGVLRWPAGPFTLWTFLGSLPRCLILAYLGWLSRDTYASLAGRFNSLEGVFSGLIVLASFAVILWLRRRLRRSAGA